MRRSREVSFAISQPDTAVSQAYFFAAVNPATRTALIETRDCTRYAIGVSSNAHGASNTYGAWAGGQAGWYEIRPPSAAYKAIYDHTIEGVSLYYTILSVIEEHVEAQNAKRGKKGKRKGGKLAAHEQLSIEALLFKVGSPMNGCIRHH